MSYFLHYLLRLRPLDKGYSLFYGSAVDEGINFLLLQKMRNQPIDVAAAKDRFLEFWLNQDGLELSKPGVLKFPKSSYDKVLIKDEPQYSPNWICLRELGYLIIEAYVAQVLPRIKEIHAVQERIEVKNEDGDEFTGLVDFVATFDDGVCRAVDNKTATIKYAANSVSESEQLATYVECLKDKYPIKGAAYIVIPKKARSQKLPLVPIDIIFGEIGEELTNQIFEKYDHVLDGIKNANFECTPDICCSTFWGCPYKNFCKSGGKDTRGLQYLPSRSKK